MKFLVHDPVFLRHHAVSDTTKLKPGKNYILANSAVFNGRLTSKYTYVNHKSYLMDEIKYILDDLRIETTHNY